MSITGIPGNIPHQGIKERNPPELHISKVRGPTVTDSGQNFNIGDIWIDLLGDDAYILVSKEAGVAVWILMSAVSGNLSFLTGDVGGAVGPDGGANIDILGGIGITTTGNPGANTITIDATGAVITFPVDDGGPGVPLLNAMSIFGTTSADFPNPSGLETHVGATTNEIYLENRRFLSSLVVDPSAVVGLRGTFTTIGAAITAAVSGDTIYVRPGTYTENLTLVAGVNLMGSTASGSASAVVLAGSLTANYTGLTEIESFLIAPAAGDAIISTAGSPELILRECDVSPAAGTICSTANTNFSLNAVLTFFNSPAGFDLFAPTAGAFGLIQCFSNNGGTDRILMGGTSSTNILDGVYEHQIETIGTAEFFTTGTIMSSGALATFNVNSVGSNIRVSHINTICNAASTNVAIGTGTFLYADMVSLGTATGIAGTLTQAIPDWKPYGTAASTSGSAVKGTAGYDSADFTVTNGFVQLNIPTISGTTTTVGAVTGDVITFPLGATPGTYTFEVDVAAFESVTPLGAGYNMSATLRTDGATSTLIGVPDKNVFEEGALIAGNADIVAGGNNMIVRVTGTAGLTVDWSSVAVRVFAP